MPVELDILHRRGILFHDFLGAEAVDEREVMGERRTPAPTCSAHEPDNVLGTFGSMVAAVTKLAESEGFEARRSG